MEYNAEIKTGAPDLNYLPHEEYDVAHQRGKERVKGDAVDIKVLAEPITFHFSERTAPNRFLKAPMTERLCHWNEVGAPGEDITTRGVPTDKYINLYKRWGEGEIGIIVGGNMMVKYDAVEAFGNPILQDNHDNRVEQYRKVVKAAKAHGSLFISQLSHPGRQGSATLNPNPVSASDVQLKIKWAGNEFNKPRALTIPEIKALVKQYGETAALCHEAGYDGVQIHCAHGYLLAQFLSQTTNLRTDEYGGPLENRSRIILEIIDEVKRRVPDPKFILCVKINSVEFQAKGTTPDDCKNLCIMFENAGLDFVELSGGTFEGRAFEHKKASTAAREAYFIEFAEMIRPHLKKTKVYVTGGFRTAAGMVQAIKGGSCDGVGLGRPLAQEPYFCKDLLSSRIRASIVSFMPLPQNTQSSGAQIHQIGAGEETISDWSDKEEVTRWLESSRVDTEKRTKMLPKVDRSGYAPIKAVTGFAYLK